MNKKGVDFSFAWIFAIIAGAAILVSAIYITTRLVDSSDTQRDTFVAGELANLLNPIETSLEDSRYSTIDFSLDTRLYNECSTDGAFGVQRISTAARTRNEWSEQSVKKSIYNKYIFSKKIEETKNDKLHVIVNQISIPFKVGDAIVIYSGDYCLINPTNDIKNLISDLGGNRDIGINISTSISSCPRNFTTVCFDKIGCDVNVNTFSQIITKNGNEMYYDGEELMFAAIMSDPEIYECQLKRLMKRASELAVVYSGKAGYIEGAGCSNNLITELQTYILSANISSSKDFTREVIPISKDLERRNNELATCKVF